MSKITLDGVILPKPTTMPELDFEPIVLYSKASVTGRLHNVYQVEKALSEYGDYNSIRFSRKFKFEIIGLTYAEWQALDAIDGTNCHLIFERDTYTEEYVGNLDCTFFKFDEHNYFDAVNIEFTVTSRVPQIPLEPTLMWIGFDITPPVEPNNSLMWISDTTYPAPTDYDHYYEFVGSPNDSVSGNNLIPTALTYGTDRNGVVGRGAALSSSTRMRLTNSIGSSKVSVSMWINTSSTGYAAYLYCSSPSYYYPLIKSNSGLFGIYDTAMRNLFNLQLNRYNHIVMTQDGLIVKIYVGGVYQGSITSTKSITSYPINYIGSTDAGETAIGRIEDVKIWTTRILTDNEVAQLFNLG